MEKRTLTIAYNVLLLLILTQIVYVGSDSISFANQQSIGKTRISNDTITQTPITITSDADFSSNGFTGSGTALDPYLLSSVKISAPGSVLTITDTSVYFVIANCEFNMSSFIDYSAIKVTNSKNGKFVNNTINSNGGGIWIDSEFSQSITLINNTIMIEHFSGIYSDYYTNNLTISNNTISGENSSSGIIVYSNYNVTIDSNIVSNVRSGLMMSYSINCTIKNNIFGGLVADARISYNENMTVTRNNFTKSGIDFTGVSTYDFLISHNNYSNNLIRGKSLFVSYNKTSEIINSSTIGQILLVNSNNVKIENIEIENISIPIFAYNCSNLAIINTSLSMPNNIGGYGIIGRYGTDILISNTTITGGLAGKGIYIDNYDIFELTNNTITNAVGIDVELSTNGKITNNTITSSKIMIGVIIYRTNMKIISNNNLLNSSFYIYGDLQENFDFENFTNNYVNLKPVLYLKNLDNFVVNQESGQIIIYNSTKILIKNKIFENVEFGISIYNATDIIIQNVEFLNMRNTAIRGIEIGSLQLLNITSKDTDNLLSLKNGGNITIQDSELDSSITIYQASETIIVNNKIQSGWVTLTYIDNIEITENEFYNSTYYGVKIGYSLSTTIKNNLIDSSERDALNIWFCQSCIVESNEIIDSKGIGIYIMYTSANISKNTIINSTSYGIYSDGKLNKSNITLNNFINNNGGQVQGYDVNENNYYDHNYWNDHTSVDMDNDGIADDPYYLDGGKSVADMFPLVIETHEIVLSLTVPLTNKYLRGEIDITWSPSHDFWGHEITFDLYYSLDEGVNWILLDQNNKENSFHWDSTSFENSLRVMFKLVATYDGGTKAIISGPYEISNQTNSNTDTGNKNTDTSISDNNSSHQPKNQPSFIPFNRNILNIIFPLIFTVYLIKRHRLVKYKQ